jgi:hypothetical protein
MTFVPFIVLCTGLFMSRLSSGWFFFAILCFFVGIAASTTAQTAAILPALDLPWPCGTTYRISQDHNTGSHKGKGSWAWDVHISDGSLVTAPADGVVRMVRDDSTRFGCDPKYAWDANYVVLDFGTGYEALFLHLKAGSVRVRPGQSVRAGEPIGEVGNSGWVCGTHLHFQIQKTCESWWCPSVPASFADVADASRNTRLTSQNCPVEMACTVSSGQDRVIDERDPCYRRAPGRWYEQSGGHDGRYDYTFATDDPQGAPTATWRFDVETSGRYAIEVYIPQGATSRRSRYVIDTGRGAYSPRHVDQGRERGWVSLGEYYLSAGRSAEVTLSALTGEAARRRRRVAFDAIRVAPVHPRSPGEQEILVRAE